MTTKNFLINYFLASGYHLWFGNFCKSSRCKWYYFNGGQYFHFFRISKRWLNLRRYFEFLPLITKGAKSLSWAENLNFLPKTVNNLYKFSAQEINLAPFVGNGTKVKILLCKRNQVSISVTETKVQFWYWYWSQNFFEETDFFLMIFDVFPHFEKLEIEHKSGIPFYLRPKSTVLARKYWHRFRFWYWTRTKIMVSVIHYKIPSEIKSPLKSIW